jgi:tRNA (guanine-N7-)-methyltransferase
MSTPSHPPLRSFGRIKSRAIKPAQGALLETLLPRIAVPSPEAGPLNPAVKWPGFAETWLEIGFGGGEHLAGQAEKRPDVLFLGAEPFLNGAASALRHIDQAGLENVRLHVGDARLMIETLPSASIDRVFIMFPDPWPKARHHKRRLVQQDFVAELARIMRPGARLRFATDWGDYADWALERFLASGQFDWTAERAADWRQAPSDHITTRYQEKRLGDIEPVYLDLVRT